MWNRSETATFAKPDRQSLVQIKPFPDGVSQTTSQIKNSKLTTYLASVTIAAVLFVAMVSLSALQAQPATPASSEHSHHSLIFSNAGNDWDGG